MADSNRRCLPDNRRCAADSLGCVIFELGRGGRLPLCFRSIHRNCGTRSQLPQSRSVSDGFRRSLAISVCRQRVRFALRVGARERRAPTLSSQNKGWSIGDSNPGPLACQQSGPASFGCAKGIFHLTGSTTIPCVVPLCHAFCSARWSIRWSTFWPGRRCHEVRPRVPSASRLVAAFRTKLPLFT